MTAKANATIGAMSQPIGFDTPCKQSTSQRGTKQIETESQAIKRSCGIATQAGVENLFNRVRETAKAIQDASNAYLKGDVSEERAREGD